jgi:hypothetical protein
MRRGAEEFRRAEPLNIVRLDGREAGDVIRFKKLCIEKLGQRFQRDANYRHSAVDALLASVENLEEK